MDDVLRTGEVAQVCQVSVRTVAKWIDQGLLRAHRLPCCGRAGLQHRRVLRRDLEVFARAHEIPIEMLAESDHP